MSRPDISQHSLAGWRIRLTGKLLQRDLPLGQRFVSTGRVPQQKTDFGMDIQSFSVELQNMAKLGDGAIRLRGSPVIVRQVEITSRIARPRRLDCRRTFGTDGAAAGASSIGRRVRLIPSYAYRAPATAPAVGTKPISPAPFAP